MTTWVGPKSPSPKPPAVGGWSVEWSVVPYELRLQDYRAIFENTLDGIMLTSSYGQILAVNPAACRIMRMSEDEMCRSVREDVMDPTTADEWEIALAERERVGHTRARLSVIRGDGTTFVIDATSTIFFQNGQRRACVVFRDISATEELIDRQAEMVGELYFGIAALKAAHLRVPGDRPQS